MAAGAGKLVGIDLGTTFSAIATLDDRGQPTTLPNRDGEMLTPSAVLLLDDGSAVVGQAALDVALEQPDRVATLVKRRMGYPNYGHPVAGRDYRPETLSALILRKLVQDAELRLGPISKAVITVPAYFDDTRRKATKDAGRIAGLEVLDILDEPTAPALACSQAGNVLSVPLNRAEFETLTRDLLIRTRLTTQQVVRQAGLNWEQVDRILLVGGSTRMPMTGQMLEELTGKMPDKSLAVS